MNEQIFLSYRRSTASDKVRLLKLFLEKCGYTVFMDQDKINRCKPFTEELERKIDECTDFIVVVTPGSLQHNKSETDFLYEEMLRAYTRNKNTNGEYPRLHVVAESEVKTAEYGKAYAVDVPSEYAEMLATICALTPLSALDFSGRDEEILSRIKTMMKSGLAAQPSEEVLVDKDTKDTRGYRVDEQETQRLTNQGEAAYEHDRKLLQQIIDRIRAPRKRQPLTVLDVGCANGKTGKKYFAENPYINKVVGIDRDQNLIYQALEEEQCRSKQGRGPRFVYKQLDLSAKDFEEVLTNLKRDNGIDDFDIIFCCQVLHHVAKPRSVMEKLNKHLKSGGCFIIRASDDGSKMVYCPGYKEENDSLMKEIIDLTVSVDTMADRFYGRKLCMDLESIELTDVLVKPITTASSIVVKGNDRSAFLNATYEQSFLWRSFIFKDANGDTPDEYKANEHKMNEKLDKLKKMFDNRKCWYSSTDYFGYGFKK